MALRDQPYLPLYIKDYLTDERLSMCSWQTQGIYVRILCNLHKQETYGAILFKQNLKQSLKQNESIINYFATILCKLIPCRFEEMECAIAELMDNNVLKFDGEKLYQKRMYNDGNVSIKRSEAAKKGGGNPTLKSTKKPKNLFKQNPKQITANEIVIENEDENVFEIEKGGTGGKTVFEQTFESFRKAYPGTKRGFDIEFKILQKHTDWRNAVLKFLPALEQQQKWRAQASSHGAFVPGWPMLQTWLNQRRWEEELNFDFKSSSNGKRSNQTAGNSGNVSDDYKRRVLEEMGISPGNGCSQ